jgi:hypothetical protein
VFGRQNHLTQVTEQPQKSHEKQYITVA